MACWQPQPEAQQGPGGHCAAHCQVQQQLQSGGAAGQDVSASQRHSRTVEYWVLDIAELENGEKCRFAVLGRPRPNQRHSRSLQGCGQLAAVKASALLSGHNCPCTSLVTGTTGSCRERYPDGLCRSQP